MIVHEFNFNLAVVQSERVRIAAVSQDERDEHFRFLHVVAVLLTEFFHHLLFFSRGRKSESNEVNQACSH